MKNRSQVLAGAFVALLFAAPLGAQDYLYTPAPAEPNTAVSDGVLVREVTVKKGDTLYRLSREFSGRGRYYPQILLFNELKNPNLIYPGEVLRVPVSRRGDATSEARPRKKTRSASSKQRHVAPASSNSRVSGKSAVKTMPAQKAVAVATGAAVGANERTRYAMIQEMLKRGDCQTALPLLDGFIESYPNSPLMPEATLNRAECYLKISSQ